MKFNFRKTMFRILLSLAISAVFVQNASAKSTASHRHHKVSKKTAKNKVKTSKIAKFTKKSNKKVVAKIATPKAPKKMSEKNRKELAWSQVVHARAVAKRNKAAEEKKTNGYSLVPSEKSIEDDMDIDSDQKVNLTSEDSDRDTATDSSDFIDFDENVDDFGDSEG